jgi:hypothetical protein
MMWRAELMVDDLLSDPMILSLMKADGVDPIELRRVLRSHARRIEDLRAGAGSADARSQRPDHGELVRDCIHFAESSSTTRHRAGEIRRSAPGTRRPW